MCPSIQYVPIGNKSRERVVGAGGRGGSQQPPERSR